MTLKKTGTSTPWRGKRESEAAGKRANGEKMLGFYVDLDVKGETVLSPADIASGTIAGDLQTAAQWSRCSSSKTTAA